ncbi:hypothetical protein MNB_SM-3-1548 [hydrothermal vent metagenome]|uniref:Uncharacterized protein n=1 Tax=hydrothermal vent metagenome TaxID=652676 RepID=A0A1W1D2U1_9ZZZZ
MTYKAQGVLVDPYIVGSILYQDENDNKQYDEGELISSTTTLNGEFGFTEELTPGKIIRIKTQGKHEGVTYDLDISSKVDINGTISVVSPMTTFISRNLTKEQIADILNQAAKDASRSDWSINANLVLTDPLSDGLLTKTVTQLSDEDLVKIQASLATYGILKVMNGSTTLQGLNGQQLYDSGKTTGKEVNKIATVMVDSLLTALNKDLLSTIKGVIDTGKQSLVTGLVASGLYTQAQAEAKIEDAMPEPTADLIVKVAVAVIDRLADVGYTTCNKTPGEDATKVNTALQEVANNMPDVMAKIPELGQEFYGMMYQKELSILENVGMGVDLIGNLPSALQAGYNAKKAGNVSFRFDASNNIVAVK